MKFKLLAIFFMLAALPGFVFALPCNWYGTAALNGDGINGSLIVPYDNATLNIALDYLNPAYGSPGVPIGEYYLAVNNVSDEANSYIYFKYQTLVSDQTPSKWIAGEFYGNTLPSVNLTFTDADNDNYAKSFTGYNGADKDCDDNNASIYPGSTELCNGVDDNCNSQTDEGYPDLDGDSLADCSDTDDDNDGILDNVDSIIGFSSDVNTNIAGIAFSVNGTVDKDTYNGISHAVFTDSATNKTIVEFDYNFSGQTVMYLANVNITNNFSAGEGSIIIKGINLTGTGLTKTAYIDNIGGTSTICIVDAEVATIAVSGDCTNGVKITCDGTNGAYSCASAEGGARYMVTGLVHSAVSAYSYTAPTTTTSGGGGGSGGGCYYKWDCSEWSECSSTGQQTRTCANAGYCPDSYNPPATTQSCTYTPPKAAATETKPATTGGATAATPTLTETIEETTPVETTPEQTPTQTTTTQPTPSGMSAITGAVIGAAGKAGIGGLIAIIIIIGGLMVYSYYGGMPGSSHLTRAAAFHKKAEKAHKKGSHEKAEKLYKKAQELREIGEKQIR